MTKELFFSALLKFTLGVILVCLLLFLPAGTLRYPNAWLFLAVLFIPMFLAGLVMMAKNPELLRKRLKAKEQEGEQALVIKFSGLMFVSGFVLAALDFRFSWLPLPVVFSHIAAGIFLLAYLLYGEVLRENTFLSRTIEVQENQTVIDTGLYGIVRHPMYSATILLFLSIPFILGSLISLFPFLFYPLLLVKRIRNEEKILEAELEGYAEYKSKVIWRLLPFVW